MSTEKARSSRAAVVVLLLLLIAGVIAFGAFAWSRLSRTQNFADGSIYLAACSGGWTL